jgi:hypothetical protein
MPHRTELTCHALNFSLIQATANSIEVDFHVIFM